jgi:hypothetical protein
MNSKELLSFTNKNFEPKEKTRKFREKKIKKEILNDIIELSNIIENYNLPKNNNQNELTYCGNETLTYLTGIIVNNEYVKSCISNKNKDINSLSYLIYRGLSQSDCIKLGTGIEKVLKDIILDKNKLLQNIKPKNTKGQKEKDHLFKDDEKKIIYYAELKSNLNLDTEKCKSTSDKCVSILEELKIQFPDYEIKMFLIGLRYFDKKIIPKIIMNKYKIIQENVVGINDYFEHLHIDMKFADENEYKGFLNILANSMFK